MSVDLLVWSYRSHGPIEDRRLYPPFDALDRNELAVVRWLLWRFNGDGGKCNPSAADIEVGTGLAARTIHRAKQGLRSKGLISWREGRSGGKRGSCQYDLSAIWAVCDDLSAKKAELSAKRERANGQKRSELSVNLAEEKNNREKEEEKEGEKKSPADAADLSVSNSEDEKGGDFLSSSPPVLPPSVRDENRRLAELGSVEAELAALRKQLPKLSGVSLGRSEAACEQLEADRRSLAGEDVAA